MVEQSNQPYEEINLSELLASLWSHKALIVLVTCLSTFLSGYYTLIADKQYTATAIFEIEHESSKGLNLSGELGALASLAGISGSEGSGTEALLERIMGREFILQASQNLSYETILFFKHMIQT